MGRLYVKNKFLQTNNNNDDNDELLISKEERESIHKFIKNDDNNDDNTTINTLKQKDSLSLQDIWIILDTTKWYNNNNNLKNIFKPILLKLTLTYLLKEKHHGKPLDSVQRFHLSNGAELYQINYLADCSRKGIHIGFGMMVNYRYR